MDKNSKEFKQAKIYQVLNTVNDSIYIGSTCQTLRKRLYEYRKCSASHVGSLYDEMRRLGKEHFYIELIEDYPCEKKMSAYREESLSHERSRHAQQQSNHRRS